MGQTLGAPASQHKSDRTVSEIFKGIKHNLLRILIKDYNYSAIYETGYLLNYATEAQRLRELFFLSRFSKPGHTYRSI
jgi:hypothetical protein